MHFSHLLFLLAKEVPKHTHTPSHTLLLPSRHLLCVVLRRDHAEHEPAQPKREGQTFGSALLGHEQRHQRRRRSARGAS